MTAHVKTGKMGLPDGYVADAEDVDPIAKVVEADAPIAGSRFIDPPVCRTPSPGQA